MTDKSVEQWKAEYEVLITSFMNSLHLAMPDGRRKSARYKFPIEIKAGLSGSPIEYKISDISIGGLAIITDINIEEGTQLTVIVRNQATFDIEVVGSTIQENAPINRREAYTIRSKYVNEFDGYMAFVTLWRNG